MENFYIPKPRKTRFKNDIAETTREENATACRNALIAGIGQLQFNAQYKLPVVRLNLQLARHVEKERLYCIYGVAVCFDETKLFSIGNNSGEVRIDVERGGVFARVASLNGNAKTTKRILSMYEKDSVFDELMSRVYNKLTLLCQVGNGLQDPEFIGTEDIIVPPRPHAKG